MIYAYLAIGGALGTFARFALSGWVRSGVEGGFPWGTLSVNLLGSFLLGLLMGAMQLVPVSPEVRALLTVGFCGAFTTFSTLTFETVALLQGGELGRAVLYTFGSLGFGLAAIVAGLAAAPWIVRAVS